MFLQDMIGYCDRLARRKLAFIAKSDSGLSVEDLSQDLIAKVIEVYHNYESTVSDQEHLKNICKKAARNHALSLIDYHTATRRRRLDSSNDGFSATTNSLDLLQEMGFDVPSKDSCDEGGISLRDNITILPFPANKISLILLGNEDKDFQEWLAVSGAEAIKDDVLALACMFYNMPLSDYRNVVAVCFREKGIL